MAAETDFGSANEALHKIAKIGSYGRNPQNCQRDLIKGFVRLPVSRYIRKLEDSTVDSMLYPHELFHMLFTDFRHDFRVRLGAHRCWLEDFWRQFSQTPEGAHMMREHPHLRGPIPVHAQLQSRATTKQRRTRLHTGN